MFVFTLVISLLLLIPVQKHFFAQSKNLIKSKTILVDLNNDGMNEKVELSLFTVVSESFSCNANSFTNPYSNRIEIFYNDSVRNLIEFENEILDFNHEIMDLNIHDNLKDLKILIEETDVFFTVFFLRAEDNGLGFVGSEKGYSNFIQVSEEIFTENIWVDFWWKSITYFFNGSTFEKKSEECFELDIKVIASEEFYLYSNPNENSQIVQIIKKNESLNLIEAYIDNKISEENDFGLTLNKYWYKFKLKDSITGWAKYKNFKNKISGLPKAG